MKELQPGLSFEFTCASLQLRRCSITLTTQLLETTRRPATALTSEGLISGSRVLASRASYSWPEKVAKLEWVRVQ